MKDRFLTTFKAALNSSRLNKNTRDLQYAELLKSLFESPIIENGLTACAKLFWRCNYKPQLHCMLYQNGLIGLSVFLSFIYFCLFGKQLPRIISFSSLTYAHAIPYSTIWFFLAAASNHFGYNVIVWILMIYYYFLREKKNISDKNSFAN